MFIIADVLGVDDVNQQIDIDLVGTFRWTDPRLAAFQGCRVHIDTVWFPRLSLFNSSHLRLLQNGPRAFAAIGPGGEIEFRQRFTGLISTYHELKAFPIDDHAFEIQFGSFEYSADDVILEAAEPGAVLSRRLNIAGWEVASVGLSAETRELPQLGMEVSVMSLAIEASRSSGYFVFRVLLPLAFVVAMSWVTFWVPPSRFEFQIGLGATSMLTIIAFNLAIANTLPRLGYLTTIDLMLIWAIGLVFLAILQALVTGSLSLKRQEAAAQRIDRISRYAFPALLFLGLAASVLLR